MLDSSDDFEFKKPRTQEPLPPLMPGIKLFICVAPKIPIDDLLCRYNFFVEVIDIQGDQILGKCDSDLEAIQKDQMFTFDKSYIWGVSGGWDYALKHQFVVVSKGILYHNKEIDYMTFSFESVPMSYGMCIGTHAKDHLGFDFSYEKVSLKKAITLDPEIIPWLKMKRFKCIKIGGVFIEVDTFDRDLDRDEWQYHDDE